MTYWGFRGKFNMHLGLRNNLLLPYKQKAPKNAKISLSCKSENMKSIKLVTSLFDETEQKLRTDTLFVPIAENWKSSSTVISLSGSRFFNLELIAEGIDSTYWNNSIARVDSTCNQNLWISQILVEIDGVKARQYTESALLEPCKIKSKGVVKLKNDRSFAHIPALKEKKIIALGESFHGSESFQELFYQIVKHQVLHNQCKLILLEFDMSMSLTLNSFIHGNENFHVDSILYDRRLSFYSYRQLKNVLMFLKDYNKSASKKVNLIGIDTKIPQKVYFPDLFISDYLKKKNKNHNYKKIDTLCYELMLRNAYDSKIGTEILKLERNSVFREMIGVDELKIFSYCCNSYMKRFADKANIDLTYESNLRKEFELSREIWMFDHTRQLIDILIGQDKDSKVLLYGHTNHLSYKAEQIPYTFGQYMKELYGDNYYNICLLVNEGSFRTSYRGRMRIMPLQKDNSSIESEISYFSSRCLYIPVTSLTVPHIRIRNMGNQYIENQFKTITPSIRFDAFI
jgi:erythromycin esterase-like protein